MKKRLSTLFNNSIRNFFELNYSTYKIVLTQFTDTMGVVQRSTYQFLKLYNKLK